MTTAVVTQPQSVSHRSWWVVMTAVVAVIAVGTFLTTLLSVGQLSREMPKSWKIFWAGPTSSGDYRVR